MADGLRVSGVDLGAAEIGRRVGGEIVELRGQPLCGFVGKVNLLAQQLRNIDAGERSHQRRYHAGDGKHELGSATHVSKTPRRLTTDF